MTAAYDALERVVMEHDLSVSRETFDRLSIYGDLLQKWQPRINLISRNTLETMWHDHFWDSLQLLKWVPGSVRRHVDLGSGAGFPGLVLAIAGIADKTVLIESDQRKAAFLREVIRQTGAPASVLCQRIESAPQSLAQSLGDSGIENHKPETGMPEANDLNDIDLITARALAPLDKLLGLACPLGHSGTQYLFPKGQNVDAELTEASKCWIFSVKRFHGVADARTTVLRISDVNSRSTYTT